MGFSALSHAWFFLLLVPLVLFYFLKLRRPRYDVSSLALWRAVLDDSRVNSPFQRFKRHLLLLLQVLLLLLLVTGAMQPYRKGGGQRAALLPVLVDCSASMAARERPGGPTRLELARIEVGKLIDGLLPGQQLCLISFAASARRRTPFTADRRLLRRALAELEVEETPADLADALRMTRALAQSSPFDRVALFSDGNFPVRTDFALPFELEYHALPAAGPNIGITALDARLSPQGGWQLFVQLEGSPGAAGTGGTLTLLRDGEELQKSSVTLSQEGARRLVFSTEGGQAAVYTLRLAADGFDALASDDTAYLALPAVRPLTVRLHGRTTAFRLALEHLPGVALVAADEPDLWIGEGAPPPGAGTVLQVGVVPPDLVPLLTIAGGESHVVDWRRTAPLLQHVNLHELVLLQQPRQSPGAREGDYEQRGYEVLIHGAHGPLLLRRRQGDRLSYHLLFDPERSTLPYRVGFPILIHNLVAAARRQAGLSEARAPRTGVLPALRVAPRARCRATGPQGQVQQAAASEAGWLAGLHAPRAGIYRIEAGDRRETLGASLLSSLETRLTRTEQIRFDDEISVAAAGAAPKTDRPLWRLLAWLALGLLLVEWWCFQRRPRT